MIDSVGLIHIPQKIRNIALWLLGVALLSAVVMTTFYVAADNPKDPKYADWILLSMSVVQITLAGFAGGLVLFFSEREVGTDVLQQKTDQFLNELLPSVLAKISPSYDQRHIGSRVTKLGRSDIFGAAYELSCGTQKMKLWVGLNVSRIIVVYWIDVDKSTDQSKVIIDLQKAFFFTFEGANKVGFSTNFEPARSPTNKPIVSIWSNIKLEQNLLLQPSDRLFWMQDIAMMTESFWRTAIRNKVQLSLEEPSPL